jgi:hypothetical protein
VFSATFQICASKSKHFTFPSHLIQQRSIWTNALNKLSCRKLHKPKLLTKQLSRKRDINSAVQLELG